MNSQQEQDFADFVKLLACWGGAYQCAVISYVALKTVQGPRLLFGRVLLQPSRIEISDEVFTFETEHVAAARFVARATPADITSFLNKAKTGEIVCIDDAKSLALAKEGNVVTHFAPIYHPFISGGPRLPSLLIRGNSRHDLLTSIANFREVDWELKAADAPFDSFDDLLGRCDLPTLAQMGDLTTLEIVARSPGMIVQESAIKAGEAKIQCRIAAALNIERLRIGYKIFNNEGIDRGSLHGAAFAWRQEVDTKIGSCNVQVGDALFLQAFLSYKDVCIHEWWVTDPEKRLNPRYSIHQIFDDDLELLRRMLLQPDTDKPYAFENAVSTMLSLLGFSVSNYGRIPKLQKGPDIIAIPPSGDVSVVECTMGLLDENGKIAKLVQRAKLIREQLNQSGYAFLQLQPLIVTPLSRAEVTADLETARKHDIAVICKAELEEMLNQVSLPLKPDTLFQDAKKLVPGAQDEALFWR